MSQEYVAWGVFVCWWCAATADRPRHWMQEGNEFDQAMKAKVEERLPEYFANLGFGFSDASELFRWLWQRQADLASSFREMFGDVPFTDVDGEKLYTFARSIVEHAVVEEKPRIGQVLIAEDCRELMIDCTHRVNHFLRGFLSVAAD